MERVVRAKKLSPRAVLPAYATARAAGADVYACLGAEIVIEPGETTMIGTGIALAIPDGFAGLICARSGLAVKKGLAPANKVGVIDSDYRGELIVALHNHGREAVAVSHGDRIAQLLITPVARADFAEVRALDDTDRGGGGFGSTGTK